MSAGRRLAEPPRALPAAAARPAAQPRPSVRTARPRGAGRRRPACRRLPSREMPVMSTNAAPSALAQLARGGVVGVEIVGDGLAIAAAGACERSRRPSRGSTAPARGRRGRRPARSRAAAGDANSPRYSSTLRPRYWLLTPISSETKSQSPSGPAASMRCRQFVGGPAGGGDDPRLADRDAPLRAARAPAAPASGPRRSTPSPMV